MGRRRASGAELPAEKHDVVLVPVGAARSRTLAPARTPQDRAQEGEPHARGSNVSAAQMPGDANGESQQRVEVDGPTSWSRRRYLLFAGQGDTAGGLSDLAGVFDDEAKARTAFAAMRLQSAAWAELGAIESDGRCAVLCWFGHQRPVPCPGRSRHEEAGATLASGVATGPRRWFWLRWKRSSRRAAPKGSSNTAELAIGGPPRLGSLRAVPEGFRRRHAKD
jgi:hypothetical protein